MRRDELVRIIDHTLVHPAATQRQVTRVCEEALEHGFGCVIVNPVHLSLAAEVLKGSPIRLGTTAGFPSGANLSEIKAREAAAAVKAGAVEIDMVGSIGALKEGSYLDFRKDVAEVVRAVGQGVVVKVIIECPYLTDEEKATAAKLVEAAGAHFVKTGTGFAGGAVPSDVEILARNVGKAMGVKAAGGIRSYRQAVELIAAGATRLGSSTSLQILAEAPSV
ncbi:MAG: deoxyribose-phosphate aldolase [Firmicutes bacterium]|nr:deoxyribose-phosphate aldolase [Bacillota bacterium]